VKKIAAILWHSHTTTMRRAKELLKDVLKVKVYSARFLDEGKEDLSAALADMEQADLVFLYRSAAELIWDELEVAVRNLSKPVVCVAHDPALWTLSTVGPEMISRCQNYVVQGGEENFARMLRCLAAEVLGEQLEYAEPVILPWEGIYHPAAPEYFTSRESYLEWYDSYRHSFKNSPQTDGLSPASRQTALFFTPNVPTVGLLFARNNWVNGNLAVEDLLIRLLEEKGYNVIPAFCYSLKDAELGTKGSGEVVRQYFFDRDGRPRINALVKLLSFFLEARTRTDDFFKRECGLFRRNPFKKAQRPRLPARNLLLPHGGGMGRRSPGPEPGHRLVRVPARV